MAQDGNVHKRGLVGNITGDYWIYDSNKGYDLTRPLPVTTGPRVGSVTIGTTSLDVTMNPTKTALVIIDMQNFFLATELGRPANSKGRAAEKQLLDHAIPAARKAGIQVVWLNWGLTEEDLLVAPPAVHRSFGFEQLDVEEFEVRYSSTSMQDPVQDLAATSPSAFDPSKDRTMYVGLGKEIGNVKGADGNTFAAGKMLVRHQWNTELTPALNASYSASLTTTKPDAWVHKIRMSGLHNSETEANRYFQEHGIKTLVFAGVNTDQCVGGTLIDAFAQGYDCIMLSDGCATSSPEAAQECWEYNGGKVFGFTTSCAMFREGVDYSIS